jgi:hypothetical protein
MKKQVPLLVLALLSLALAGCKRDGEVNEILATIDSFTTELVSRIETAGNPSAGVDDAQKYLDSRKDELRGKMDALKRLRESQVSDAAKQKITSSLVDDASKVGNLEIKYVSQSMNDPAFNAKLDKLVKDYQALLTP